ncbi:SMI1 / KNR4 family (SUKH-1) [Caloramator fervidus]|uniref:SMI1 / KNR4 family (SUKH-1) n=1 Tax=Caloramator fervidus TaxID=29344 RepID=A0A1H5SLJ9_9CLOT|nr:SMI1/KNR4 family protein [Caloramator fervidus]SEF51320.1 SMI1 / KNR4 family (SUKH-1) [Caloramator fervidus]
MKTRLEKFEMKYGYFLPNDFKRFIKKFGGDVQFGSCRFEYVENMVNNLLRIPGKMNFHLFPFGDVGNGDYYCFYKYGPKVEDYFVGIWLHETRNFIILASDFISFMYKCALDDIMSVNLIQDDFDYGITSEEILSRVNILSKEYGFNVEKIKQVQNEVDYHKFMIEYDEKSIQSLCYLGRYYINENTKEAKLYLEKVIDIFPYYTAPYYILGQYYLLKGNDFKDYFKKGLNTSLDLTGFSYWEEDYIEIPEDVHREMLLYLEDEFKDPYDAEYRLYLARKYSKQGEYEKAMIEYNNVLYCTEDKDIIKETLKSAHKDSLQGGLLYLSKIIENDLKYF